MDATVPQVERSWSRSDWLAVGLLVLVTLLVHGRALAMGFSFDDHNHLEQCAEHGYSGLISGNTFDWNRRILRVWWAEKETGWAYFRPVSVALRVTWLKCFGLHPLPFHVIQLGLYLAVVLLFHGLLRRCGLGRGAALVGGVFFTLHPTHAQVSGWLASDVSVLSALGYVLGLWSMHASARAGHRRPVWMAAVAASYALALLTRESGLMLGPILLLFDWLSDDRRGTVVPLAPPGRRRWLARPWRFYASLAALGVFYLVVRSLCLGKTLQPRSPYFHWPTEPDFATWLPWKLLSDLVCLPWGLPNVAVCEVPWLQAHPGGAALAVVLVLAAAGLFLWPLRRSPALWGLLAGSALAAAPTVLVFSTGYNYYLVSAGWAAILALWTAKRWPLRPRWTAATLAGLVLLHAAGHAGMAWQFRMGAESERLVLDEVLSDDPASYPPDTKLFFVNLPLFAAEVGPAIRLETGRRDLEAFALTMASPPWGGLPHTYVLRGDQRTLVLGATSGDGWFAGELGERLHLGWYGASRQRLLAGSSQTGASGSGSFEPARAAGPLPFRVEVLQGDDRGIRMLRMVFERPLDDPTYRFFITTPFRHAEPWRPDSSPVYYRPTINPRLASRTELLRRTQLAVDRVSELLDTLP